MLESVKLVSIIVVVCLVGAIFSGYGLLKIYDAFRKAFKTNNRSHLWLACTMAMFAFIVAIVVFTSFGVSIQHTLSENNHCTHLGAT